MNDLFLLENLSQNSNIISITQINTMSLITNVNAFMKNNIN